MPSLRVFLFTLALVGIAASARAEDLSKQDAAAIRAVITEQLDAFRRDDGERAFSLATAGIRAQFGSAEVFMEMVRTGYPVVYRPSSVHFDAPELVEGIVIQAVRMTDAEGRAWIALYPMQRQPDGRWRIDGCQLASLQGRAI
jgi:hypothetical protein